MMNDVLQSFIDRNVVICYMDDILVFTETLEEHRKVVRDILLTLQQHMLFLKPEKCLFKRSSVNYLGLMISRGCVSMDPVKVHGVSDWPHPKKVKEVQSFLGFVNFYCWFMKDFAKIAHPLHALTHKKCNWSWGESEDTAFNKLKSAVTLAPTLAFPSDHRPFQLECDTSNFATGAVLS